MGGVAGAQRRLITLLHAQLTVRLLHNDEPRFFIQPQTSLFSPTPPRLSVPSRLCARPPLPFPIPHPPSLPPLRSPPLLSAPSAAAHPAPCFNGTCH